MHPGLLFLFIKTIISNINEHIIISVVMVRVETITIKFSRSTISQPYRIPSFPRILISFNLGHGPEKLQMDIPLKVDTWHGIEVVFSMDKVGLSFDDHLRKYQRSKYTRVLDVDDIFHIGGVPSSLDVAPK